MRPLSPPLSGEVSREVQALWVPDLYMEERLDPEPRKDRLSMNEDSPPAVSTVPVDICRVVALGRRGTVA